MQSRTLIGAILFAVTVSITALLVGAQELRARSSAPAHPQARLPANAAQPPRSTALNLPPLPGQHPWSHRGQDNGRSSFSSAMGPETPVIEPAEWPYDQVDSSLAAGPVVDAEGTAYFGSTAGTFYALRPSADTTDGLLKWAFETQSPIHSAAALKPSQPDDPVRVYFTTENGHIYSLDTIGNKIWDLPLQASVDARSAPALAPAPGFGLMRVYLATANGIYALEESGGGTSLTASVLWHEPGVQSSRSLAISPDGHRLYATAKGTFYVLDANPHSGSQILAQTTLEGNLTGPVVDENDRAYVGTDNGAVFQIDAPTANVLSAEAFTGPVTVEPALAPADQLAFVSGDVLHLIRRSLITHTWRFTATAQSPSFQFASELAVDGGSTVFVVGDDTRVRAIRNGSQQWAQPTSGNAFTAPALAREGRLYVGTNANTIHAIQSDPSFQISFDGDLQDASSLDIYTIRSAYGVTGSLRRLTDHPAADLVPAYSSQGQFLAFTSDREGAGQGPDLDVLLAGAGGSGAQNLTDQATGAPFGKDETDETDPAFSPTSKEGRSLLNDGVRYLAVTTGVDPNWQLFFIDLDTFLNAGTVTGVDLAGFLDNQHPPNSSVQVPIQQAQAVFSPDGRWLAYGACVDTNTGPEYQLRAVDLQNDSQSTVATESTDACDASANFHPFFSPDSRYLVYERGNALFVTDDFNQPGTQISSGLGAFAPSWSPDGTEIVYNTFFVDPIDFSVDEDLYSLYGPQYVSSTLVSGSRASDGVYHPRRLPEPNTRIARCNAQNTLSPTEQKPGQLVTIRGCGFDIRYPENNAVYFPKADGPGMMRTEAVSTAVELSTGLGIITAEVPLLAGDGQLVVDTHFGASQTLSDIFRVLPLATAVRMAETVPNAFIRVMGYGIELDDKGSYQVRFSGASASPVTPTEFKVETCGQAMNTPCSLSQLASGEIGWLSVQVPSTISSGPVLIERTVDGTPFRDTAPDQLSLLTPAVDLSRHTGSAGDPQANLDPVEFTMEGFGFPYDPYFGYTQVDLVQVDPSGQEASLGSAAVDTFNDFPSQSLEVQPNSGGQLSMEARLPAQQTSGILAKASAPFTTPLKDLPIVFVPGTSGTFIEYDAPQSAGPIRGRLCGTTTAAALAPIVSALGGAPAGVTFASFVPSAASWPHLTSDYWPGENVWLNFHGLAHILIGCPNWLDAIHFNPNNNQAPSKYADMKIGDVMKKVTLPGMADKVIYSDLFGYMVQNMNREIVEFGDSCSGNKPCVYLFNMDWRKAMDSQALRLDQLVNKALNESGRSKVAIITHSYGGPTTKYYLRTVSNAPQKVDQVIALGGGFMGVVKPYKILELGSHWGLKFGPFRLKDQKPQQMARDWPTAYWQLPQSNWSLDGSNGHNVNTICPYIEGTRDCGWIRARWDATQNRFGPFNYSPGPGVLGNGQSPYGFVENATALHPFRGRPGLGPPLKKFYPNINNSSGKTKYPLGAVYQPGVSFSDKFGEARDDLLDVTSAQNRSTLHCPQYGDTGLGDWRCGTQGVFFHRIVGWGKPTQVRVEFTHDRKCLTRGSVFGINVSICVHIRNIEEITSQEGDNVIPLRSAVGILANDATFDSRDSRIWGIDGAGKQDYNGDGSVDGKNLHFHWPQLDSVHQFIKYAIGGKLTDITQLPGPNPQWPSNKWPFKSPCGVPARPSSVPQESNCGSGSTQSASVQQESEPDSWVVEFNSMADLHVRNEEGQHAGPVPELPGVESESFAGVEYIRDAGRTRVYLPVDSGEYSFRIEGVEFPRSNILPDIAELRIYPEGYLVDGPIYIFHALPIKSSTEAAFVWNTDDPAEAPSLQFDLNGDGEIIELTPDATLTGPAATDEEPPSTSIEVDGNRLHIEATDEGGAGIYQIYYGTDRGRTDAKIYEGPVDLPAETTFVWAFAVDRAGNSQLAPTIYRTCQLPMDFDGDGAVAQDDVTKAADKWLSNRFDAYNLNGLGSVDVGDIQRVATNVGEACPNDLQAAPDVVQREETDAVLRVSTVPTVTVGEHFTVNLAVENPADLAGLEAVAAYPPPLLELTDVSPTGSLAETGRATGLLGPYTGDLSGASQGAVAFGAYSIGPEPGLDVDGSLIQMTFRAAMTGTASLEIFEAQVADSAGTLSEPTLEGTQVEVVSRSQFDLYLPILGQSEIGRAQGAPD